jgi:iron(III) transport system permease protein
MVSAESFSEVGLPMKLARFISKLRIDLPWIVFLVVTWLVLLPLGFLLYGALMTGYPGQVGNTFTLDHLLAVYGSTKYLRPLVNTLWLATLTTAIATPTGTLLAWLIARTDLPSKRLVELAITTPLFISPLLGSLAWIGLAAPGSGIINAWLGHALWGLRTDILDIYSFPAIVFVMVIYYVPLSYLLTVGGFSRIDATLEEAGRTVGCNTWQVWSRVTIPLLTPTIIAAALMVFVLAAEQFAVPALLGIRGNFTTIPVLLYQGFNYDVTPPGEASALATQLVLITLLGVYLYRRTVRVARRYVTIAARGGTQRQVTLGQWTFAAWAFIAFYLALAVIFPCIALLMGSLQKFLTANLTFSIWTLDNYRSLLDPRYLHAILISLGLASAGAVTTVTLALIVGYLTTRSKSKIVVVLDYVSSITIAVPGIAMGVGLLWAYTMLPLPIYGTFFMLLIAYMTRFLGQSVRLAAAAFQQIEPNLEEAGRMVGLTPLGVLRVISLNLIKPSIISACTLIFIFIIVEIPATILLYTPATETMAVVLFNAMDTSGTVRGFTIGVVQIIVIFIALAVAYRRAGNVRALVS